MSLKKQTLSGLVWTFSDIFVLKGSTFLAQLILARLLGPEEFGLLGMIAVFVAIGTALVDSGLSASLIRTRDADERDFSTVFYSNLAISVAIYSFLYLGAPYISAFYSQPILTPIIRVYCLSFVITSFTAVQVAILVKNLEFKKLAICNLPGVIIGVALGIYLGYRGFGAWSVVWMYLVTLFCQAICLWVMSKWKPSLTFSYGALKHHFNFGYKLMFSGLLNTVFENFYHVLIGKFYPVKVLGFYERASLFTQYPVATISAVVSKVTYPVLSSIQEEKDKISLAYKKILQITFFVTAPLMLGAAALAHPLILLVLGSAWQPAIPFFQILCLASIFYPIQAFNLNILKVYGRSDLFLKLELFKKGISLVVMVVAFQFGIYALVWSSVLTAIISLLINTHYSSNMINYSVSQQLKDMLPTFATAVATAFAMIALLAFASTIPQILQLLFVSMAGVAIYILLNYLFGRKLYLTLLELIQTKKL